MNTLEKLHWRYATKQFDPAKKLTEEQVQLLLESLRLAPSSYGLQPWKFILVTDPTVREQLRAAADNQPQVTDASHFIVLAVPREVTPALVDQYMNSIVETRGVTLESLQLFRDRIVQTISKRTEEENHNWSIRQAYIALGMALGVAAVEQIDTCALEGFNPDMFDTILGLSEHGFTAVVALAAGFRAVDDAAADRKKVRFLPEEVIIEI